MPNRVGYSENSENPRKKNSAPKKQGGSGKPRKKNSKNPKEKQGRQDKKSEIIIPEKNLRPVPNPMGPKNRFAKEGRDRWGGQKTDFM